MQRQRIEKLSFGYAVYFPAGWEEYPPDLKSSPVETARFDDTADRRHSLIVFRGMPHPGLGAVQALSAPTRRGEPLIRWLPCHAGAGSRAGRCVAGLREAR